MIFSVLKFHKIRYVQLYYRKPHVINKMNFKRHMTVPSSLTTIGTDMLMDLAALTMPFAIVAQLTMPPNTFTKIAFT